MNLDELVLEVSGLSKSTNFADEYDYNGTVVEFPRSTKRYKLKTFFEGYSNYYAQFVNYLKSIDINVLSKLELKFQYVSRFVIDELYEYEGRHIETPRGNWVSDKFVELNVVLQNGDSHSLNISLPYDFVAKQYSALKQEDV